MDKSKVNLLTKSEAFEQIRFSILEIKQLYKDNDLKTTEKKLEKLQCIINQLDDIINKDLENIGPELRIQITELKVQCEMKNIEIYKLTESFETQKKYCQITIKVIYKSI